MQTTAYLFFPGICNKHEISIKHMRSGVECWLFWFTNPLWLLVCFSLSFVILLLGFLSPLVHTFTGVDILFEIVSRRVNIPKIHERISMQTNSYTHTHSIWIWSRWFTCSRTKSKQWRKKRQQQSALTFHTLADTMEQVKSNSFCYNWNGSVHVVVSLYEIFLLFRYDEHMFATSTVMWSVRVFFFVFTVEIMFWKLNLFLNLHVNPLESAFISDSNVYFEFGFMHHRHRCCCCRCCWQRVNWKIHIRSRSHTHNLFPYHWHYHNTRTSMECLCVLLGLLTDWLLF